MTRPKDDADVDPHRAADGGEVSQGDIDNAEQVVDATSTTKTSADRRQIHRWDGEGGSIAAAPPQKS